MKAAERLVAILTWNPRKSGSRLGRMVSKLSGALLWVTLVFLLFISMRWVSHLGVEREPWRFILYMANVMAWAHLAYSLRYYRRATRICEDMFEELEAE